MGYDVGFNSSASEDKQKAVSNAESVFIGGGNTFRLLETLYQFDLLDPNQKTSR